MALLDGKTIKGEPSRLSWSPDAQELCLRTAEGDKPTDRVHFYVVPAAGGALTEVDREPDWAEGYWAFKSDRFAPGLPEVMIDVQRSSEIQKVGTGSAGALAGSDRAGGGTVMSADNIDREAQNQKESVLNLTVYGEVVSRFVNERPIPGWHFGWGPKGSGAIAFVDSDGRLFLLDGKAHRRAIAGVKDAFLPAWTTDGKKLAYVQKTGRKRYAIAVIPLQTAGAM